MTQSRRRAVFLDRDGVLNQAVAGPGGAERPPWRTSEVEVLAGAPRACALLRREGWLMIVVTNQPDIAYGRVDRATVDAINGLLVARLGLDAVYVCPHGSESTCACRKPGPGLLLDAAADHGVDLGASWLVGDRWVDIAAGRAANVRTVLIERPASWHPTSAGAAPTDLVPDARAGSLLDAVQAIAPRPSPAERAEPVEPAERAEPAEPA